MNYLERLKQFRKDTADSIVDGNRTKTSANDHDHWFVLSEVPEIPMPYIYHQITVPDESESL